MKNLNTPQVHALLPANTASRAVRAAVMAMKLMPIEHNPLLAHMEQLKSNLLENLDSVAIIDLEAMKPVFPTVLDLVRFLNTPLLHKRIVLTRHLWGPVWEADRNWIKGRGFCDIFPQLDSASLIAEGHSFLDHVATITDSASIEPNKLKQYFSAMQISMDRQTPYGLIRKITGLDPQSLCYQLASNVKAIDRTYHLKSYPACMLGSDAVSWLATQFRIPRDVAVSLGSALEKLGFLHHVMYEQPFADSGNFYRTAISTLADNIDLDLALIGLRSKTGVEVKDRVHLAKTYPTCFIGSEAVTWAHQKFKIPRHTAEDFLNRLYGFGFIEHVTQGHKLQDGHFFYRFA